MNKWELHFMTIKNAVPNIAFPNLGLTSMYLFFLQDSLTDFYWNMQEKISR